MGKVHLFLLLRKYDTKSPSLREIDGSVAVLSAGKIKDSKRQKANPVLSASYENESR